MAWHLESMVIRAGHCHQNCDLWPRSLCHHKPRSHTATLSVLDFRSAEKWARPSAHAAHDVGVVCCRVLPMRAGGEVMLPRA